VDRDSAAAGALKKEDVIMEINRKNIIGTDDYRKVVSKIGSYDNVLLLLFRNGSTMYVTLSKR
jgi:S1-C subfamily serine protease